MVRRVEEELGAQELPPLTWYDVLWAVRRAPERRLRIHEIADEVVLSRTGTSRLVERIVAAGLLAREPVPGDRRGSFAVLTDDGEAMLRDMWPVYARVVRELFAPSLGGDAERLTETLRAVARAAREAGAG